MTTTVTMTLWIAKKPLNDWMEALDVKPYFKWYIQKEDVTLKTESVVDDKYYMNLIQKSFAEYSDLGFWIPAISTHDKFYVPDNVKILSDGEKEMFVHLPEDETVTEQSAKEVSASKSTNRIRRSTKR